jgi:VanZ family protein
MMRRIGATWRGGFFLACTLCYAALLQFVTHHPHPELLFGLHTLPPDKLTHFLAYAVLGALASATVLAWRIRPKPIAIAVLCVMLIGLAAVDETTQPVFRRQADLMDWVFDVFGIAVGVATALGLGTFGAWAFQRSPVPRT